MMKLMEQWLPNQLSAVMDTMISIYENHLSPTAKSGFSLTGEYDAVYRKQIEPMIETVRDQRTKLAKEVQRWCKERGVGYD